MMHPRDVNALIEAAVRLAEIERLERWYRLPARGEPEPSGCVVRMDRCVVWMDPPSERRRGFFGRWRWRLR